MRMTVLFRAATVAAMAVSAAFSQGSGDHWVATWGTSAQIYRGPAAPPRPPATPAATSATPAAPPAPAATPAVGANPSGSTTAATQAPRATPPRPRPPQSFENQTVRMIVHTSIGGGRLRLELTNPFGATVVAVGAAHIALRDKDSAIVPASDRALTINGSKSFKMSPGQTIYTDPVDLNFSPLSDLAVSLFFPEATGPLASHSLGLHTTYISGPGDFTAQASIAEPVATSAAYYWISSVDVLAPADSAAIITLGDSITDGAQSTPNTDRMWPARLAARLQANKATANIAVDNQGISGNRLLQDGAGVAALARLDHDVLLQSGAKWVMILEGINDIGNQTRINTGLKSEDLIGALRQIVERAHTRGLKVIGCTLTPYKGAGYYSEDGEVMREAENDFIRHSGIFDAVVDFDAAVRDPNDPHRFRQDMQSGDQLHPSDAGYQVMADSIDLSIFTK
ncbi:MAG TPA: SGNH/GDSL hydrolase family protein [Bryobacteraceae bacterium]|nr:SGNH/GDSL hydrolase family protein [Bryobacteraceae bacterium]